MSVSLDPSPHPSLNLSLLWQILGPLWFAVLVASGVAFTIWVRFFYRGS